MDFCKSPGLETKISYCWVRIVRQCLPDTEQQTGPILVLCSVLFCVLAKIFFFCSVLFCVLEHRTEQSCSRTCVLFSFIPGSKSEYSDNRSTATSLKKLDKNDVIINYVIKSSMILRKESLKLTKTSCSIGIEVTWPALSQKMNLKLTKDNCLLDLILNNFDLENV